MMLFPLAVDEHFVPSDEVKKNEPPPENAHLKLACIRSQMCHQSKLALQECHAKISKYNILHKGETCDEQILNFINCLEKCIFKHKDYVK